MSFVRTIWTHFTQMVAEFFLSPHTGPLSIEPPPHRPDAPRNATLSENESIARVNERMKADAIETANRMQEAQSQIAVLTAALDKETQRRATLESSAQSTQIYVGRLKQQLESAQGEAEGLKAFLTTYDDVSDEQIGDLLKDINDRISDIACENAHRWLEKVPESSGTLVPLPKILEELGHILSPPFVKVLADMSPRDDEALFLIQSAWQACIVDQVHAMLEAFSPVSATHGMDSFFHDVGGLVHRGESQPIYGRWRALTHQYMRVWSDGVTEKTAIANATKVAVRSCYVTGCVLFRTQDFDAPAFESAVTAAVEEVLTKALALALILREHIVSKDYWPLAPSLGQHNLFDPRCMATIDKDNAPPAGNEVLCTVRLGMTAVSKKPGAREKPGDNWAIFRPAEVLTLHCLEEVTRGGTP